MVEVSKPGKKTTPDSEDLVGMSGPTANSEGK
jgi:hypothetical protein